MREGTDIQTINELKLWIEGQFRLITQGQDTNKEDLRTVRSRLHELSNDVAKVTATIIDFNALRDLVKKHDTDLEKIATASAERKGAIAVIKTAYFVGGAFISAAASAILFFSRIVHT